MSFGSRKKYTHRVTRDQEKANINLLASRVTELTGDCALGATTKLVNLGAKRGKGLHAEITLPSSSGWYSSAERLAYKLKQEMDKKIHSGAVRVLDQMRGEVRNLADPLLQLRSIAAIFVKKYRFASLPIANFYPALRKRELTKAECEEIVGIVSRLGKDQKDACMLAWLEVLERGGEQVRLSNQEMEDGDDDAGGEEVGGE